MRRKRHAAYWLVIGGAFLLFPPAAAIMAAGYAGQWAWERWS